MATPGKPLLPVHRFSDTLEDGSVLTDGLFAI